MQHRDPAVVQVNRLAAHGLGVPDGAVCLDGDWGFTHWTGTAPDVGNPPATTLTLPTSWVLHGHGIPIYTNVQFPFDTADYPEIPLEDEGGDHTRTIAVPADWSGQRVILRVGAAESAMEVFVDGAYVGYSTDSRLPAEFDLTDVVSAGQEHTLTLRVHRWTASTWLEDQDMWWMAGLHRSLYLYAKPEHALADVVFRTTTATKEKADVSVTVSVSAAAASTDGQSVSVALVDPSGQSVFRGEESLDGAGELTIEGSLIRPDRWTAETPLLHDLSVELRDSGGVVSDQVELRVGICAVQVASGELRVNGKPVTIRGVNRHEHSGTGGRYLTDDELEADMALLKASNVNAIRTSHYPNDDRVYDLCDKYGFYVFDEANIETHGLVDDARNPSLDKSFAEAFVARGQRMALRDRNHPCVIAWSLGNESGFGDQHRAIARAIRDVDPTRPIVYHPAEDDPVVDVLCPMYPSLGDLEDLLLLPDERPIIMCEYSHAMGNSNGGISRYWDMVYANHRFAGGFIWDWVDQGLERFTDSGERWWAYGGDFGDQPNDWNFNLNGLVDADLTPHPALAHVAWTYRPVHTQLQDAETGQVLVSNRRDHTDLQDLAVRWTVRVDGAEVAAGQVTGPAIAPHEADVMQLPFRLPPGNLGSEAHLWVEWLDAAGAIVATDEMALPTGRGTQPTEPDAGFELAAASSFASTAGRNGFSELRPSGDGAELSAGDSRLVLNELGEPQELTLGGADWPISWARIGIERPGTDNDRSFFGDEQMLIRLKQAGVLGVTPTVRTPMVVQESSRGVIAARTEMQIGDALAIAITWMVDPGGDVAMDLRLHQLALLPPIQRMGLEMELPGSLEHLTFFGPGPTETYVDRLGGFATAIHHQTVTESLFPFARPQDTGNHAAVRWGLLHDGNGAGILAMGNPMFDTAALHVRAEDLRDARHAHEVNFRSETVWRLDAAHSGLGTASCGPGIDQRDLVSPEAANRIVLRNWTGDANEIEPPSPSPLSNRRRWLH